MNEITQADKAYALGSSYLLTQKIEKALEKADCQHSDVYKAIASIRECIDKQIHELGLLNE